MLAMKQHVLLTIASLLSILFLTFHLADDIVRGFEQGGLSNLVLIALTLTALFSVVLSARGLWKQRAISR